METVRSLAIKAVISANVLCLKKEVLKDPDKG